MATYGFRLYTVKVVAGPRKSKAVPVDAVGMGRDQHIGAWVRQLLSKLEGYGTLTKMPILHGTADGDPVPPISDYLSSGDRDDPQVDFTSHTAVPSRRIRFEFSYGRVGRVPFAIGATQKDYIDLRQRATGHTYRGLFYFPKTGDTGVLALETVPSSPHPVDVLNSWLARAAIDLASEEAKAKAALPAKEGDELDPLPYKLNFAQFVNLDRLEKMIKQSAKAELVLRKTFISGSGKKKSEQFRLVAQLDSVGQRNAAVGVAKKLFAHATGTDGAAAAGIAELESLAPGNVGGLQFNDGYIKLDDGGGSKKIGLDTLDRYFDYPVNSSQRPDSVKWEQEVAKEVVTLQSVLGLDLEIS